MLDDDELIRRMKGWCECPHTITCYMPEWSMRSLLRLADVHYPKAMQLSDLGDLHTMSRGNIIWLMERINANNSVR